MVCMSIDVILLHALLFCRPSSWHIPLHLGALPKNSLHMSPPVSEEVIVYTEYFHRHFITVSSQHFSHNEYRPSIHIYFSSIHRIEEGIQGRDAGTRAHHYFPSFFSQNGLLEAGGITQQNSIDIAYSPLLPSTMKEPPT